MNTRRDDLDELIEDVKTVLDGPDEPQAEPVQAAEPEPAPLPPRRRRRKKRRTGRWILLVLLLMLAAIAVWVFTAGQPTGGDLLTESGGSAARKTGCSTVLLAGTDKSGDRTDTMLLLSIDATARKASLISLPRDTYVSGGYAVPKLNSAIGAGGGGDEGMRELMQQVTDLIGYRPDGYVLIDLDGFVEMIDMLGGVKFDVPQDMYYDDPAQDLHIALQAGMQRLDGEQSMGLVRFRSGYAQADLRRVEVQRDFLRAAAEQHLKLVNLPRAPLLAGKFLASTTTDLTSGNLLWIARTLLACDRESFRTETLPGAPRMINGGSYYVADAAAMAALLNECANPYKTEITPEMLHVRG